MTRHIFVALALASTILLVPALAGREAQVVALFNLDTPAGSPFPSDRFTTRDDTQNSGLRVSLPQPDPADVSDSEDVDVINTLDGFNLQPRLSIPFSGGINPDTVTRETVFLVRLASTLPDDDDTSWGTRVGIDQIVWDPSSETLHVESAKLLDQHTRYVLVVTKRVRDENDKDIKAAKGFLRFVDEDATESTGDPDRDAYRADLRRALSELDAHGIVPKGQVVAASVFTTQSATAILQKIRDQIHAATPDPADFVLGPAGERTVFSFGAVTSIQWNQQTRDAPPGFNLTTLDLAALRTFPGAIGRVAFGKYLSPDYVVHPGEYIPPLGTRTGIPAVLGTNAIYFNLYLPSGPVPPNGWPVAIVGHGIGGSKNNLAPNALQSTAILSALAAQGIASVTTNAVGAGFGRLGTLTVNTIAGAPVTFYAGGRGLDQIPRDHLIGGNEGGIPAPPHGILLYSDAFRQTAADLMQLVRVIQSGMDVDDDGLPDVDASRIYFAGSSWSGGYGTVFVAVEPDVHTAVLKAPADAVWFALLGPANRRAPGAIFGARQPSLLNPPGIKAIDGVGALSPFFDENFPLREQIEMTVELDDPLLPTTRVIRSPLTNGVTGAMALQAVIERVEWVSQAGSAVAYASLFRKAPLQDTAAKNVLYVLLKGDQTAPNPIATAILRAGELKEQTMYYRHDLARLDDPSLPKNPHGFNIASIAPDYLRLEATFFATDGTQVIQPAPGRYFEFPIVGPLPEGLNFIR